MRGNAITHQLSYGSVCSGIEAASVAWEPLGLRPAWFAEIEKFPSAVLAHHWPHVTNLGDMTKIAAAIRAGEVEAPDILVGGTPCQAFSIAGLRKGLSDARGQLTLAFVELANAIDDVRKAAGKPPCIIIWENVPGVLSSKDNAIGCFLAGIAGEDSELQPSGKRWTNSGGVYGPQRTVAWRILDAQYFGVAQRRRRVFVVASARTDIDPSQILFERDGVRRDTAPSRSEGKAVAALTANGVGTCGADDNQGQAGHLIAMAHGQGGAEIKTDNSAPTLTCNHEAPIVFSSNGHASFAPGVGALRAKSGADHETLAVHGTQDPDTLRNMAHTLGRNHGQENAVICFSSKDNGQDATNELSPTIRASNSVNSNQNAGATPAVAYSLQHAQIGRKDTAGPQGKGWQEEVGFTLDSRADADAVAFAFQPGNLTRQAGAAPSDEVFPTLKSDHGRGMSDQFPHVLYRMAVRRLTPRECERLQGFPDDHTLVPFGRVIRPEKLGADYAKYLMRGGRLGFEECCRAAADGPRYKAIGNSMAVPVMRWIMTRIAQTLDHQQRTDKMTDTAVPVKKRASKKAASDKPERNKPFLKWAGGKFSQLDQILPRIGTGDRLIEPFVGAGSIFLNAPGFNRYVLSDSSTDLISLYLALQAAPWLVTDKARQMFTNGNDEDSFKVIRTRFNSIRYTPHERAAAFLYLNRHSFNGLMRYNQKGEYNVGFGKYKAPYFPEAELAGFAGMASRCEFVCRSFVDTIRLAGEGDVLYCDPPYMSLPDTSGFTQYTTVPFTDEHQWQLLNEMVAAHQRGARVIVTNSGHPALIEAYKKAGFRVRELFARRSMSCKGDKREVAVDLVGVLE